MRNRLTVVGVAAVAGFVACGGSSSPSEAPQARSSLSGGDAGDAQSGDEARSSRDAGDAGNDALCQNLQDEANAQFKPVLARYQTCVADSDCVVINPFGEAECATLCGVRTNTAGAAALPAAAAMACQAFLGAGCQILASECVGEDVYNICKAGSCAGFDVVQSAPATAFVHGVCEPFEIDFMMEGAKTPAPHDIVFAMETSNGALYADAACTTPLTGGTISIPAGTSSVTFGFEPLAPGMFSFGGTTSAGDQGPAIGTGSIAQ